MTVTQKLILDGSIPQNETDAESYRRVYSALVNYADSLDKNKEPCRHCDSGGGVSIYPFVCSRAIFFNREAPRDRFISANEILYGKVSPKSAGMLGVRTKCDYCHK